MAFKFAPKGPQPDPALAALRPHPKPEHPRDNKPRLGDRAAHGQPPTAADPATAKRLQPPGQPKMAIPPPAPTPAPAQPTPPPAPHVSASPEAAIHEAMLVGSGFVLQPPVPYPGKTAIKLRIDTDVLNAFKRTGRGYQTRINAALRQIALQLRL